MPGDGINAFWSSLIDIGGLTTYLNTLSSISDEDEKAIAVLSRVSFLTSMGMKIKRDYIENQLATLKKELHYILRESNPLMCKTCRIVKSKLDSFSKDGNEGSKNCSTKTTSAFLEQKDQDCFTTPKQLHDLNKNKEPYVGGPSPIKESRVKEIYAPETEILDIASSLPIGDTAIVPETFDLNCGFFNKETYGHTDFFDASPSTPTQPSKPLNPSIGKCLSLSKSKAQSLTHSPSEGSCTPRNLKHGEEITPSCEADSPDLSTSSPSLLDGQLGFSKVVTNVQNVTKKWSKVKSCINPEIKKDRFTRISSEAGVNSSVKYEWHLNTKCSPKKLKQTKLTANSFSRKKNIAELTGGGALTSNSSDKILEERNDFLLELALRQSLEGRKDRMNQDDAFCTMSNKKETKVLVQKSLKNSSVPPQSKLAHVEKPSKVMRNLSESYSPVKSPVKSPFKSPNVNLPSPKSKSPLTKIKKSSKSPLNIKLLEKSPLKQKPHLDKFPFKQKPHMEKSPLKQKPHMEKSTLKQKPNMEKSPLKQKPNMDKSPLRHKSPHSNIQNSSLNLSKLNEDEALAILGKDSQDDFEVVKPNFRRRRIVKSPNKANDSFDFINGAGPAVEPNYAYKSEVIRNKRKRRQLEGWSCHECRDYFEDRNLSEEEKKMVLNACSRHRSKHKVTASTPEGFWDPDWIDTVVEDDDMKN